MRVPHPPPLSYTKAVGALEGTDNYGLPVLYITVLTIATCLSYANANLALIEY